jgi:branched-chain amino acid transport system permease protein
MGPVWRVLGAQAFAVAIALLGLTVVTGFSGQISLCQATFMGLGGYVFAHATSWQSNATSASTSLEAVYGAGGAGWPFAIAVSVSGLAAAVVGGAIGFPALRVRGLKLAILTIGFSAGAFVWFYNAGWTGANGGLTLKGDPKLFGASTSESSTMYLAGMALFAVIGIAVRRIRDSAVGRRYTVVREQEALAHTLGLRPWLYRVAAFAAGAGLGGIGGALFVRSQGVVAPESFTLFQSIFLAAAVVIGGITSPLGALVGAWGIVAIPELLSRMQVDPGVVALPMGLAMLLVLAVRNAGLFHTRVGAYRRPGRLAGWLGTGLSRLVPRESLKRKRDRHVPEDVVLS